MEVVTLGEEISGKEREDILFRICDGLAQREIKNGEPVLAAAECIAVNDISGALMKFIRGNLIYYAFILSELIEICYCFFFILFGTCRNRGKDLN